MAAQKDSHGLLQSEDYLIPLANIRDALLRPISDSPIPSSKLSSLLKFHLSRLQTPWQPVRPPSAAARKLISEPQFTIPKTTATFSLDSSTRQAVFRISDRLNVDEVEAYILLRSYALYSIDEGNNSETSIKDWSNGGKGSRKVAGKGDEDALLDRIELWYGQELLAIPQVVMALYHPPSESTGWEGIASELQKDILGDREAYIEGLFRGFSTLAQKQVNDLAKGSKALFWATLQLRQQEALLDLLFLILYQHTTRAAVVSESLIRGAIMSQFGTLQANREIWGDDPECQRIQTRIRDLIIIIGLESLCLSQIVAPEFDPEPFTTTLLHSRDRIHAVHQFILEQSESLNNRIDEISISISPLPIVCLGWAIALRSLGSNLLPPSTDYFQLDANEMDDSDEEIIYMSLASRALKLSSGLFPWIEQVLRGPLFETSGELISDMAALRRSPIKDLLIGLSELIHIDHIVDRDGLYISWQLLFGGGMPETSNSVSRNYWGVDFAYEDRRAILDKSRFPLEPTHLPQLLAALTGVSKLDELDMVTDGDAIPDVFDYLNRLPFLTIASQPNTFASKGRDASGKALVEATVDLELPGAFIRRGTRGVAVDEDITAISWRFDLPAWPIFINILRGSAGLPVPETVYSLVDLGIQGQLNDILNAGLQLVRCILLSTDVAQRVLFGCGGKTDRFVGQTLLDIALAALQSDRSDTATFAVDIIRSLLRTGSDDIWHSLRSSGFFDARGRRPASVVALVQSDSARGEHDLTIALLRLVLSLTAGGDAPVVISAHKLVLVEIWTQFSGWRYRDIAKKYQISALLTDIFDLATKHGSKVIRDAFIYSTSSLTFKPIIDELTQAVPLAKKLVQSRRWVDSDIVHFSFDKTVTFITTLVRASLGISATSLPHSLFTVSIGGSGSKSQLIDHLFDLVHDPSLQSNSIRLIIQLLRSYLEITSNDPHKPSLAGMLRDLNTTIDSLVNLAFSADHADVKNDAWNLLATITSTQLGCSAICIDKGLGLAGEEVKNWSVALDKNPASLAAVLSFLQSSLNVRPGCITENLVWDSIKTIATKFVPLPSSLSDQMERDVISYSYSIQSKANATALLATELARLDPEGPETHAQGLVLSLFRNGGLLEEVCEAAIYSCCDPELQMREAEVVINLGVDLNALRSLKLATEREYGATYLYDRAPTIPDLESQLIVRDALCKLNFNWSQLDADISLTKSFRQLAESASTWAEGDALAAKATLKAAVAISNLMAKDDRGGDIMFAIQAERLEILASLLETALDPEADPDPELLKQLAPSLKSILESQTLPPILSLRHDLPPLHRPILKILLLLIQNNQEQKNVTENPGLLTEAGSSFALEAADIVLDAVARGETSVDLGLVIVVLCEFSRLASGWLDRLQEFNIIARSLEILVRVRIIDGPTGGVPPHIHSILVLHLALASSATSAEKLAVSGILPAYADNAIALLAEQAKIDTFSPNLALGGRSQIHSAWCGMLMVVKALLSNLPDTASFARTDVIPFIRVVIPQFVRSLAWNGKSTISRPALEEIELVADVFYGVAQAISPSASLGAGTVSNGRSMYNLLDDLASPTLNLLTSIRHALSHPHQFSTLIAPSSIEEQVSLEKELEILEGQKDDVNLVGNGLVVIKGRTMDLIRIARTCVVSLVRCTRGWEVLAGEETRADDLLGMDESPSSDPVGVLNDLFVQAINLSENLTGLEKAEALHLAESTALLSFSQLATRRSLFPIEHSETLDENSSNSVVDPMAGSGGSIGMDIDLIQPIKRRVSLGVGMSGQINSAVDRKATVLRELESDFRGMLGDDGSGRSGKKSSCRNGKSSLLVALRKAADSMLAE